MINKYRYHIDYLIKSIVLLLLIFIVFDLIFDNEQSFIDYLGQAFILSILFAYYDFSKTIDRLRNTNFAINSISDITKLEPEITTNTEDIQEIIDKLKSSKNFGKAKVELVENQLIKVSKNNWLRKTKDFYSISINSENQKVKISTELTKSNYYTDTRRIIDLAEMKRVLTE